MVKVGFFHDAPLVVKDETYYSQGFSYEIWKRYLTVFDELNVSTRVIAGDNTGLPHSSGEHVNILPIESYKSPISLITKPKAVIKEVRNRLSNLDAAIIRLPSIIGWITFTEARKQKKPILIELVGCPWDSFFNLGIKGKLVAPFAYFYTKWCIRKAHFVIYVTQKFLQKRYPTESPSVGISNVNIERIDKTLIRNSSRTIDTNHRFIVGSIGKVDLAYKGYRSAIKAISILQARGINVQYQIVGPGNQDSLTELVEKLKIESSVSFLGKLSTEEIELWMSQVDLYIQPSLSEGLPRSVIEAMSQGLPVLLSDAGGHSELVPPNLLFKPGSSTEISDKIEVLSNADLSTLSAQNIEKSNQYTKEFLQKKRESILLRFKQAIEDENFKR